MARFLRISSPIDLSVPVARRGSGLGILPIQVLQLPANPESEAEEGAQRSPEKGPVDHRLDVAKCQDTENPDDDPADHCSDNHGPARPPYEPSRKTSEDRQKAGCVNRFPDLTACTNQIQIIPIVLIVDKDVDQYSAYFANE